MTKVPSAIPWEERNIKYMFPEGHLVVEEIKTPWDLLVESKYIGTVLGTPIHQLSVQNGLERIFSIRQAINRLPVVDILTRPVGARTLLPYWQHWRVLKTSNTFNVDGQDLIVIEALRENKRAPESMLDWVRAFFLGRGGVLGGEHPTGYVLTTKKAIDDWDDFCFGRRPGDLLCGNFPLPEKTEEMDFKLSQTTQVLTLEEALALIRVKYFHTIFLDIREDWTEAILDHLSVFLIDRPQLLYLFSGDDDKRNALLEEAKRIMKKK